MTMVVTLTCPLIFDGSGEPKTDFDEIWGVLPKWIEVAERTSSRELRKLVRRERTRQRTGEDVVDMTFHATETTREHFERARVLASRKAGRRLTNDDTFRVVVEHYVDTHDPLAVDDGTRRVGPTSGLPGARYVPVAVRRAIRRRAQDRCEMPECDEDTFLEFAHRIAHRDQARCGGGREEGDLFLLCGTHHTMLDGDALRAIGPTDDPAWVTCDGWSPRGIVCTRRVRGGRPPETEAELQAVRELRANATLAARPPP